MFREKRSCENNWTDLILVGSVGWDTTCISQKARFGGECTQFSAWQENNIDGLSQSPIEKASSSIKFSQKFKVATSSQNLISSG